MKTFLLIILGSFVSLAYSQEVKQEFILDTDSNYFADDCLALGMILKSPELKINAMTLVAGTQYPKQGIEYLTYVLKMMNRVDVPIYMGADKPLVNNHERVKIMKTKWGLGFAGAFELPIPTSDNISPPMSGEFSGIRPQKTRAHEYLIQALEKASGPVTIVAIGPLTNIARVIQSRKDLIKKFGTLIFMGGNVRIKGNVTKTSEFNFWFDPEAAQIVLRSSIARKVMIGLDLTSQAKFLYADYQAVSKIQNPLAQSFARELGEMWPGFKKDPSITHYIWDALIPIYMLHPEIITISEELFLDVITDFGPSYGGVKISKPVSDMTAVTVLTGLNYEKFKEFFYQSLK